MKKDQKKNAVPSLDLFKEGTALNYADHECRLESLPHSLPCTTPPPEASLRAGLEENGCCKEGVHHGFLTRFDLKVCRSEMKRQELCYTQEASSVKQAETIFLRVSHFGS